MSIAAGIYRLQHAAEHIICIFESFIPVSRRQGHVQGSQMVLTVINLPQSFLETLEIDLTFPASV